FQLEGHVGRDPSIVVSDLPRTSITGASPEVDLFSNIHVGGNLHFGPDELLYLSIGDFGVFQQRSADPGEAIGKLLRFTAEGQPAPAQNLPAEGDPRVFAYGLRNPFDFDFGGDGQIFAVDNGPDACDEVNIIREGLNYGWPSPRVSEESCERRDGESAIGYLSREGSNPYENGSTVGPSSLLYLENGFGRLAGPGLVVCEVNTGRLRYLPLNGDVVNVGESETLADDCFTDVIRLGDGSLVYTTLTSLRRLRAAD
ncbi:MAG TPA: PQQ-dependent sugar dehydrogenase, partial [Dehalococcoidia bacterium]|nr:PQQ-dependent sugar dehydrogenase [Dehalococcoidia bacterium]